MKFASLALCLLLCGVAAASAQIRIKTAPPLVASVVPTPPPPQEGEPADFLYKVVIGTVRTHKVLADGRRQETARRRGSA